MRDGYTEFFEYFGIDDKTFIKFGLQSIISVEYNIAKVGWDQLKDNLFNNEIVYIRGYGRDAKGKNMYIQLYKTMFDNINIKKILRIMQCPKKL